MYIALTKPQIQFMIARNKQQITELESHRKAIKNAITLCWNGCNPLSNSVNSQSAFSSLNIMKDTMRDLRKEIKKLSEIQKSLKVAAGDDRTYCSELHWKPEVIWQKEIKEEFLDEA